MLFRKICRIVVFTKEERNDTYYEEINLCGYSRSNVEYFLGITCFAEEIGASTVVGASSGNTNTGVQFDPTIYIVCGVALAVVIAVGIITAVLSKKKKNK